MVRLARAEELPHIEALLAPEIAMGRVLPRSIEVGAFLVLDDLSGTAALTPWTASVVELGSVVSAHPGRGMGRQLVEAAVDLAGGRGFGQVVVLTSLPGFFASPQDVGGLT